MGKQAECIYNKTNYLLLLLSVIILIAGFFLMTGNTNEGGDSFNEEIYSFRRITLSPVILLSGYAMLVFAIMYRKRNK